jgi:hypothetical protein
LTAPAGGRWSYGDAGDRIPVQPGDTWQVGPHQLVCGDLEASAARQALDLAHGNLALAYTDPPWNASLARGFRTKAGVDGPHGRPVNFARLLDRILQAAEPTGELWCEIGLASEPLLHERATATGATVLGCWPITYYQRHPGRLLRIAWQPCGDLPAGETPAGLDDQDTPGWVIARRTSPGDLVFDPCCGRGLTAITAAQLDRRFLGVELAPRRAAVTLDRLASLTGQSPTRLSTGAPTR